MSWLFRCGGSRIFHCYHWDRDEKRKWHNACAAKPTVEGGIYRCCRCGAERWSKYVYWC